MPEKFVSDHVNRTQVVLMYCPGVIVDQLTCFHMNVGRVVSRINESTKCVARLFPVQSWINTCLYPSVQVRISHDV